MSVCVCCVLCTVSFNVKKYSELIDIYGSSSETVIERSAYIYYSIHA